MPVAGSRGDVARPSRSRCRAGTRTASRPSAPPASGSASPAGPGASPGSARPGPAGRRGSQPPRADRGHLLPQRLAHRVPLRARRRSPAQRGEGLAVRLASTTCPLPAVVIVRLTLLWTGSASRNRASRSSSVSTAARSRAVLPGARAAATRTVRRRPSTIVRRHTPDVGLAGETSPSAGRRRAGAGARRRAGSSGAGSSAAARRRAAAAHDLRGRPPGSAVRVRPDRPQLLRADVADSSQSATRLAAARAAVRVSDDQRAKSRTLAGPWPAKNRRPARRADRRAVHRRPAPLRQQRVRLLRPAHRPAADQPLQLGVHDHVREPDAGRARPLPPPALRRARPGSGTRPPREHRDQHVAGPAVVAARAPPAGTCRVQLLHPSRGRRQDPADVARRDQVPGRPQDVGSQQLPASNSARSVGVVQARVACPATRTRARTPGTARRSAASTTAAAVGSRGPPSRWVASRRRSTRRRHAGSCLRNLGRTADCRLEVAGGGPQSAGSAGT